MFWRTLRAAVWAILYLYFTGVVGSVVWIFSTEAHAAAYGADGWNPFLVAAVCTAGQHTTYVVLYFFGRVLTERSGALRRAIARVQDRFGDRLHRYFEVLTGFGALLGFPPAVGMVLLSPSFGLRLRTVFAITVPLRFVRFAVLAYAGESLWPVLRAWWAAV